MSELDKYLVDLKGMTTDVETHQWQLGNEFFECVQGAEIQQGQVSVQLTVKRSSSAYNIGIELEGVVRVQCDRCLEMMEQPIRGTGSLRIVLGDEYADDGELVTVPFESGVLNTAWHIYEAIALALPLRHVHPDGQCDSVMQQALSAHTPEEESDDERPTDPRWNELKKILNKQ